MTCGKLTIYRFNGTEEFQISEAKIMAWRSDGKVFLNLEINSKTALKTLPDTKELKAWPSAEVSIILENLIPSELTGKTFTVERGMNDEIGEWVGRFYYCEHEDLNNNIITFESQNENIFHVKWSGTTIDVNYYDGSKPESKIEVDARFTFSEIKEWMNG